MSFPWESIKADGARIGFVFNRVMVRVLVGYMPNILFNIICIILKKGNFGNNDKIYHFPQFFAC